MAFFEDFKDSLKLTEELLCVLKCFLDPTKMIKEEEVPDSLNPNAEVLELSGSQVRRNIRAHSNAEKVDAIWNFFNLENEGNA